MTEVLGVAMALVFIVSLIWLYDRRANRIYDAAVASVTWHEDKGEWSVTWDGVRWYVETIRLGGGTRQSDLSTARAFPFGYQAGFNFTLKLHGIIERAREKDVAKEWRAKHGVELERDKST